MAEFEKGAGMNWVESGGGALPPNVTAESHVCGALKGDKNGDMDFGKGGGGGGITGQDLGRAFTDSTALITHARSRSDF